MAHLMLWYKAAGVWRSELMAFQSGKEAGRISCNESKILWGLRIT